MDADDEPASYASPPCLMHEIDPAYAGLGTDTRTWLDVNRWRKATREDLIAKRLALAADTRAALGRAIMGHARAEIGDLRGRTVSLYWPFRGEPDPRELAREIVGDGGHCALPVVVAKGQPLAFHRWTPGDALARGVWNIPVPAAAEDCSPDIVLAPVVGFDARCFRLGYGGGYFDRTLAAMASRPLVIGVGYELARLTSIFPQPHDIAPAMIATEAGVFRDLTCAAG